ncbi:DUF2274 domain-containing protein [Pseudothauera nasutitermitis]|uniref:DUF2274 domain-containing protein n=1 Tax=Pseudothauera nasutitermitis TaxID=2565930 RepID=A0A4S4B4K0_9RHOO|nr:DUF2274 domain-containing protein [Pseudothauera nasutitermitis]
MQKNFTSPALRKNCTSSSLKADLDRYAALHAQAYGEAVDAMTLIPHMLEAFMAGDRGFKKGNASKAVPPKPS